MKKKQKQIPMAKGKKHLTTEEKAIVVGMAADGASIAHVARKSNLPWSTVKAILQRCQDQGTVETAQRSGRPRKTTERLETNQTVS